MELRRAILLFAIVLGLAAIATSLSRPPRTDDDSARGGGGSDSVPTANPRPGQNPPARLTAPIVFREPAIGSEPQTESVKAGRAATVRIQTSEPGEISVDGLGLLAYADTRAPARLDVLTTVPDRHAVRFDPTTGGAARTIGYLQITP